MKDGFKFYLYLRVQMNNVTLKFGSYSYKCMKEIKKRRVYLKDNCGYYSVI